MSHYSITALSIATVDQTHLLDHDPADEHAVGIGLFTCAVRDTIISFELRICSLEHGDFAGDLAAWLDEHLPTRGTIAGYEIAQSIAPVLNKLPGAADSPAVGQIGGEASRLLIDLRGVMTCGNVVSLAEACTSLGIPASRRDANERFTDWIFGRQQPVVHALGLDAIATLRLAFRQLAALSRLGGEIERVLEPALQTWLAASDLGAAMLHRSQA